MTEITINNETGETNIKINEKLSNNQIDKIIRYVKEITDKPGNDERTF